MVSEELIRQRSYEIWQRRGCPEGSAIENWVLAKSQLEAEARAAVFPLGEGDFLRLIAPKPSISRPPRKRVAERVQNLNRPQAA